MLTWHGNLTTFQDRSLPPSALTHPTIPSPVEVHAEDVRSTGLAVKVTSPPPPTPREEVLHNQDILTLIFGTFLSPTCSPPQKATRAFLHGLALLCRSFSGPALDCLWKDLDSLLPLVRLLEPLVFVVDGVYYPSGSISGLGGNFDEYASRVRSLHIVEGTPTVPPNRVDPSVCLFLTQFLDEKPLLPGLNTLHFETVDDPSLSWQTLPILFPCSSLSSVVLKGTAIQDPLSRRVTVPLLVARSPALKSFTINDQAYTGTAAYETFFTSGVLQLQNLRSLSCTLQGTYSGGFMASPRQKVPQNFLEDLGSKLRHLEQLTLDLELPSQPPAPISKVALKARRIQALHNAQSLFLNLRRLSLSHLSDTQVMKCENISSLLRNVVLLTLTIRQSWMSSFTNLVNGLSQCRALRHLTLKECATVTFTTDNIRLILTHLTLDELHIQITELAQPRPSALESSGGAEAHSSEPTNESAASCLQRILTPTSTVQGGPGNLRSLTLPWTWKGKDASLTLLVEVARKAPNMEYLGISLDSSLTTSKPSELSSPADKIPSHSALKYLQICDRRTWTQPFTPTEYKTIARYLDACFPNLMELSVQPSSSVCVLDHWAHVEHLRVMYREMRTLSSTSRYRV